MILLKFGPAKASLRWPHGLGPVELAAIPDTDPVSIWSDADRTKWVALKITPFPSVFRLDWEQSTLNWAVDADAPAPPQRLSGIPRPAPVRRPFVDPRLIASWATAFTQ